MQFDSTAELVFDLGDATMREGFRARGAPLVPNGDSLLAAQLPLCMRKGTPIRVDEPVSPRLLAAVPRIQSIYKAWFPRMVKVDVIARPGEPTGAPGHRVGTFFSAGVDSFYTLLEKCDDITDLILMHGFDIELANVPLREKTSAVVREIARELGKGVVEVELDFIPALRRTIQVIESHGAVLATIGHLLAPEFHRVYVPASCYLGALVPWGSHPLLDPLWSSERMEVVHHGDEIERVDRVIEIAKHDIVLRTLRVCAENEPGEYNCGRCEKCVRTMISLRAAGALERCTAFREPLDSRAIARYQKADPWSMVFIRENLRVLEQTGADPVIEKALRSTIRRRKIRDAVMWIRGELQIRARAKRLWRKFARS